MSPTPALLSGYPSLWLALRVQGVTAQVGESHTRWGRVEGGQGDEPREEKGEGTGEGDALRNGGDAPSSLELQGTDCCPDKRSGTCSLETEFFEKRQERETGKRETAQGGCLEPALFYPDPSPSLTR